VAFEEVGQAAAGELGIDEDENLIGFVFVTDDVGKQVALEATGDR
jgi:hypothetical protein